MQNCVSAFAMTSLLPAASPSSASQFLKAYEDEFIDIVNAKQSVLKLKHKGVISQAVRTFIEDASDEDAKYLLFEHLEKNATFDTLREYCEVAISDDGFPRMQAFGKKMMETLSLGGLLELWVWLVHICTVHANHRMNLLSNIIAFELPYWGLKVCKIKFSLNEVWYYWHIVMSVHLSVSFSIKSIFPFLYLTCTAPLPQPASMMTEAHPKAKQRRTGPPDHQSEC